LWKISPAKRRSLYRLSYEQGSKRLTTGNSFGEMLEIPIVRAPEMLLIQSFQENNLTIE